MNLVGTNSVLFCFINTTDVIPSVIKKMTRNPHAISLELGMKTCVSGKNVIK